MKLILIVFAFLVSCLSVNAQQYVVTASSCENTSAMTTVFSAVIDSNWNDHHEICFFLNVENKQNSGIAQNQKVILWIQGIPDTLVNATVSNNIATGRHFVTGRMYREGASIYVGRGTLAFNGAPTPVDDFAGGTGNGAIINGVDFTAPISIQITIQWSTANNVFYRVLSGTLTQN